MKTNRLIIRPLKISDYKKWFDSEPKDPTQCTIAFFEKIVERYKSYRENNIYYNFGIFEKKSGSLVGELDLDIKKRKANIGYAIYEQHWYQGFGREAVKEAIKYGFKKLQLEEINAKIGLDNKKSIRMAKAIGMKKKKNLKRHVIYVAYASNN